VVQGLIRPTPYTILNAGFTVSYNVTTFFNNYHCHEMYPSLMVEKILFLPVPQICLYPDIKLISFLWNMAFND
jgi:hypothetical protein